MKTQIATVTVVEETQPNPEPGQQVLEAYTVKTVLVLVVDFEGFGCEEDNARSDTRARAFANFQPQEKQ